MPLVLASGELVAEEGVGLPAKVEYVSAGLMRRDLFEGDEDARERFAELSLARVNAGNGSVRRRGWVNGRDSRFADGDPPLRLWPFSAGCLPPRQGRSTARQESRQPLVLGGLAYG